MAFQLAFSHPDNGVDFPAAYHRIEIITLTKASVQVSVRIYATAGTKDRSWVYAKEHLITGVPFMAYFGDSVYIGGTTNPIRQAYIALKALAEYVGATDV